MIILTVETGVLKKCVHFFCLFKNCAFILIETLNLAESEIFYYVYLSLLVLLEIWL